MLQWQNFVELYRRATLIVIGWIQSARLLPGHDPDPNHTFDLRVNAPGIGACWIPDARAEPPRARLRQVSAELLPLLAALQDILPEGISSIHKIFGSLVHHAREGDRDAFCAELLRLANAPGGGAPSASAPLRFYLAAIRELLELLAVSRTGRPLNGTEALRACAVTSGFGIYYSLSQRADLELPPGRASTLKGDVRFEGSPWLFAAERVGELWRKMDAGFSQLPEGDTRKPFVDLGKAVDELCLPQEKRQSDYFHEKLRLNPDRVAWLLYERWINGLEDLHAVVVEVKRNADRIAAGDDEDLFDLDRAADAGAKPEDAGRIETGDVVAVDPKRLTEIVRRQVKAEQKSHLSDDILIAAYEQHGSYRKAADALTREGYPATKDKIGRAVNRAGGARELRRSESSASITRSVPSQRRVNRKKVPPET